MPAPALALLLLSPLTLALHLSAQGRGGSGGTPPPVPDLVFSDGKMTSNNRPLWVMSSGSSSPRQVLGEAPQPGNGLPAITAPSTTTRPVEWSRIDPAAPRRPASRGTIRIDDPE